MKEANKHHMGVVLVDEFNIAKKRTMVYSHKIILGVPMKNITKHEIIEHGLDNCQTFPDYGTIGTEYEKCYIGIGDSAHGALEDALDCAAQDDWYVEPIENKLSDEIEVPEDDQEGETQYYVVLRIK